MGKQNFPPGICLNLFTCYLHVYIYLNLITWSGYMRNFCHAKAWSQQYKGEFPPRQDEIFHMELQDIIYEKFIALLRSR